MNRIFTTLAMVLALLVGVLGVARLVDAQWLVVGLAVTIIILGYGHLTGQ